MKIPSITTKRTAVELGIKYSMTDEQVIELLKGAKVPKAQRDLFIPWFRAAEKRSIARDNSRQRIVHNISLISVMCSFISNDISIGVQK